MIDLQSHKCSFLRPSDEVEELRNSSMIDNFKDEDPQKEKVRSAYIDLSSQLKREWKKSSNLGKYLSTSSMGKRTACSVTKEEKGVEEMHYYCV